MIMIFRIFDEADLRREVIACVRSDVVDSMFFIAREFEGDELLLFERRHSIHKHDVNGVMDDRSFFVHLPIAAICIGDLASTGPSGSIFCELSMAAVANKVVFDSSTISFE